MLSPMPPCVYLPLPAGLLGERDRRAGGERGKATAETGKTRGKQAHGNETVYGVNKALKQLCHPLSPLTFMMKKSTAVV